MPDSLLNEANGFIRPLQVGARRTVWPFAQNGDVVSTVTTVDYVQLRSRYYPPRLGVDRDPEDPWGYVAAPDSNLSYNDRTGLLRFTRTYARIPATQTTYPGSRYITKPDYTSADPYNPFDLTAGATSKGTAVLFSTQTSKGTASYSALNGLYTTGDGAIYTNIKVPSSQTVGYATGGTFTLTRDGDTTAALAWDATAATILAALNGLASTVADGITFSAYSVTNFLASTSGGALYLNVSGGTEAARQIPVTMDAASLTITGTSAHPVTAVIGSAAQAIYLPAHLSIASHGLDTTKALAIAWASTITTVLEAGYWGSINANTIWCAPYGNTLAPSLVGTYSSTYLVSSAGSYAGGNRLVRTRLVETFYLPGVSSGITTPADITVPASQQNPSTFLTNLLTPLTGWQDYDSDGPAPWLGGPIHRLAVTQVKFEDLA